MVVKKSEAALNEAINILSAGGIVICPTDTVYGFLADATNKKAVDKIYKIKKRPKSKPLAVFVKNFKMAKELAEIDEKQKKIIKKYWPGKYTFILKRKKIDVGRLSTIGLRVPKYEFLNDLLKKIDRPLVQTSVNVSNNPCLVKISDIIERFGELDVLIIDGGNLRKSKPSKITDLAGKYRKVLRN